MLLSGAVLGAMLAQPSWLPENAFLQFVVPQGLLIGLIIWVWIRARRQEEAIARLESATEAIQFHDWERGESLIVSLLQRPLDPPGARLRALLGLATVAEGQRQYAVCQHVLERVRRECVADRGLDAYVRIALADTMLQNDQLHDAVQLIERLNREDLPASLKARVEMLNLFRAVRMGQAQDAVDRADERRELFRRHLGTKAGYGYGLLAAAFDRAGESGRAAAMWCDATTLLDAAEIVDRFAEVRFVAAKYSSAKRLA